MIFLEPEERVRQQEVPNFVPAEVEDQRAPVLMLTLARIGMLVKGGAVEPRQPVPVDRKMKASSSASFCRSRAGIIPTAIGTAAAESFVFDDE